LPFVGIANYKGEIAASRKGGDAIVVLQETGK